MTMNTLWKRIKLAVRPHSRQISLAILLSVLVVASLFVAVPASGQASTPRKIWTNSDFTDRVEYIDVDESTGAVYATGGENVSKLNSSGSVKWNTQPDTTGHRGMVIQYASESDIVMFGVNDQYMYGLDPSDGSTNWFKDGVGTFDIPRGLGYRQPVDSMYMSGSNFDIHEWSDPTNGDSNSRLSSLSGGSKNDLRIGGPEDTVAYLTGNQGYAIAFNVSTASTIWEQDLDPIDVNQTHGVAVNEEDGLVYIGMDTGTLYGLDQSNGTVIFQKDVTDTETTIYQIEHYQNRQEIIMSMGNGNVTALSESDRSRVWTYEGFSSAVDGLAIDTEENHIYAGSQNGNLHAIEVAFKPSIRGTVTDENGYPIEGATVEVNGTLSDTTDSSGFYSVTVDDGEYTVNASKNGYKSKSADVEVSGSSVIQDFTLQNLTSLLELDIKRYMNHGDRQTYTVLYREEPDATQKDVTDSATVTSNNTSVISVDLIENELIATSDKTVAQKVEVTAEYNGSTVTKDVTVANKSLQNMDILPPWQRFDAVLNSRLDGDGIGDGQNETTILLLVGALAGAIFSREGSTYYGLGAFQSIVIMGWILGKLGNGVLLISLVAVGFVMLNLAANIDYGFSGT